MSEINGISDFGRGWATYQGDNLPEGWLPDLCDTHSVEEWVNGFASAHAECMDETETWQEALKRIAPEVYAAAVKLPNVSVFAIDVSSLDVLK